MVFAIFADACNGGELLRAEGVSMTPHIEDVRWRRGAKPQAVQPQNQAMTYPGQYARRLRHTGRITALGGQHRGVGLCGWRSAGCHGRVLGQIAHGRLCGGHSSHG